MPSTTKTTPEEDEEEGEEARRLRVRFPMLYEGRRKRKKREKPKDLRLCGQRYRRYLRGQLSRSLLTWTQIARTLFDGCATWVEAGARGRLGRRRFRTCEDLRTLHNSSFELVQRILATKKKRSWFDKDAAAMRGLGTAYLELCERRAWVPPRFVVENRVRDVAERVVDYTNTVVTAAQARWRGITVRRFFRVFHAEKRRRCQTQAAAAIKLSPLFRRCFVVVSLRRPS